MGFTEQQILAQIPKALAGILDLRPSELEVRRAPGAQDPGFDLLIRAGGRTFAVEVKSSAQQAPAALSRLKSLARRRGADHIPLLVVPHMTEFAKRACEQGGVSWFDLSGNASITAKDLHIRILGLPDVFKRRGRPSTVFGPKSSRIARFLLINSFQETTQAEIVRGARLEKGFVSKVVRRLVDLGHLRPSAGRKYAVVNRALLLDAWCEENRLSQHAMIGAHLTSRSGPEMVKQIAGALDSENIHHAFTGLAAAWLYTQFASFRLASLYVDAQFDRLGPLLGAREVEQGANLWLLVPRDDGVYMGLQRVAGFACVHPAQVYVDLKNHPERSQEAAEVLRERLLGWPK